MSFSENIRRSFTWYFKLVMRSIPIPRAYPLYVFDNAKVNIKDENAVSVDIEVTVKNELHSLEGLKELEYYFKDYDIRIW